MTLFKDGDDPKARLDVVEQLTEVEKLVQIACSDDSPRVRLVAVSRISEDDALMDVVRDARELDARLVAVERISSEQRIADIARDPKNLDLVGMCFSRITDRRIIESIAEDTACSKVARRMAVEHYADESYLSEADDGRKSEESVQAFVQAYGGGLRGVRAIGRFRRSEKALRALGTIAQKGGDTGGLAVEYLCNALGSANPKLAQVAMDELATVQDPEMLQTLILALDNPKLQAPIHEVLARIDTPEARAALGEGTGK
jgi:hypothetical protein